MIVVAVFLVYGLLLFVDAGIVYRESGGRNSLIAGIVSGTIVVFAAVLVLLQVRIGASVGLGAMLAMLGIFGSRYSKTKKFIPSGMLLIASIIGLGILFVELFQ